MFSSNSRYTYTTTKIMYDLCAHGRLTTSAILVLDLLKKKEDDEQFCVGSNNALYLALHKHILAVLKVATNADTTIENA